MTPSGWRKTQKTVTESLFLGSPSSRLTGAEQSKVPEKIHRDVTLTQHQGNVFSHHTMLGDVELSHFRLVVRTPNLEEFDCLYIHETQLQFERLL